MRFQASAMFSDNMVLQRGKNIRVFGTGEDGVKITAQLCGFTTSCTVANGVWRLVFPPMGSCRFTNLVLTDDETGEDIVFENVAIGEVWLACGGSGMELPLEECAEGMETLDSGEHADIRYYAMPRCTSADSNYEQAIQSASWSDYSNPETAKKQSAVGYYCAKTISEYLNVPVGIIECVMEYTSASCWLDREYSQGGASVYFAEYDKAMEGKTAEEAIAEFRRFIEHGGDPKEAPHAPCNPRSPGVLHESMIKRICPYTIGGVLWYQGEPDICHPHAHFTLLTQVIRDWRGVWDEQIPFIIGQLPMFADDDPEGEALCLIREAQMRVYNTIRDTGICVLLDCADREDVREIGRRFAMQVLNMVNGGCDGAFAPTLKSAIWRGDTVELQFNDARGGFKVINDEPHGFEICGTDGVYYPAIADVSGEKIFLTCEQVPQPTSVRYLWSNYAEIHIRSMFGLPLVSFRVSM